MHGVSVEPEGPSEMPLNGVAEPRRQHDAKVRSVPDGDMQHGGHWRRVQEVIGRVFRRARSRRHESANHQSSGSRIFAAW